ncbi:contact-dependent growth inhibition system immunity protein [uncultured Parasphingopyxis sp.]|uniref:contact-dependent growth inhibition system immunity protein n=1 Tax=uncultured Parasphingopyxis sp. TaxID=1547918 RepID=UPI0026187650|nr:contact-dependent growth inhibition system immunity protein [uncultured Parasphingopyxis sp.]
MSTSNHIDRFKTLQELEGEDWGDPETAETPMIGRVLALRRKPLHTLSDGEVRLAIGQKVSLPYLLELAIERLRLDPLIEGDYYPGDVLSALVHLDEEDWHGKDDLRAELTKLFRKAMKQSTDDAQAFRKSLELPPNGHRMN